MSDAFVSLKSLEMIKLTTDMSGELAFFQGMEVDGLNHYDEARKARRWFEAVMLYYLSLLFRIRKRELRQMQFRRFRVI